MEETKLNSNDWEILTDNGWKSFTGVIKNENIKSVKLKFDDGTELICSENHELLTYRNEFIYANESAYKKIKSINGYKKVVSVTKNGLIDAYDVTSVDGGRYITNDVVSHNCNLLTEFWASVYPIISSSKKSKVIMASTPRDTSGLFYKLYDGSIKQNNNWASMKIKWDEVPGRDEKWKRETMASLENPNLWRREFEVEFDEVGESALNIELFEQMRSTVLEPKYILEDGCYKIWEDPNDERCYVVGVDIAEGIGRDSSCIQILDITEPRQIIQVASYNNNKIAPAEFTAKLYEILDQWGRPHAMIERNNCGSQVVDNLKRNFGYENIVSWGSKEAHRKNMQLGMVSHINTKHKCIMNMRHWMLESKSVVINDLSTVLELRDFTRYKNGTWAAKANSHDDRVMSLAWALMMLSDEIVDKYYEVLERDEFRMPMVIKPLDYGVKYLVRQNYENESAMPSFMGGEIDLDPDLEDLKSGGWRNL